VDAVGRSAQTRRAVAQIRFLLQGRAVAPAPPAELPPRPAKNCLFLFQSVPYATGVIESATVEYVWLLSGTTIRHPSFVNKQWSTVHRPQPTIPPGTSQRPSSTALCMFSALFFGSWVSAVLFLGSAVPHLPPNHLHLVAHCAQRRRHALAVVALDLKLAILEGPASSALLLELL
jgi:hypothetical protein